MCLLFAVIEKRLCKGEDQGNKEQYAQGKQPFIPHLRLFPGIKLYGLQKPYTREVHGLIPAQVEQVNDHRDGDRKAGQ